MPNPARYTSARLHRPDEMKTAARWDDRILSLVMLVVSVPRVVLALATGESFGAESSVAAVVAGLGFLLLSSTRRR